MELSVVRLKGQKVIRDKETKKKLLQSKDKITPFKVGKWKSEKISLTDAVNNETDSFLAHTGQSNIIVLDFDSDLFNEAMVVDAACRDEEQCKYISKSIDKDGGHFIYKFQKNKLTEYIANDNGKKLAELDTLMGETLALLATPCNETKVMLTDTDDLEELTEMPLTMQLFIMNYYMINTKQEVSKLTSAPVLLLNSKIGYVVESALNSIQGSQGEMTEMFEKLLVIITTKHWKNILSSHKTEDFDFHPNNLPAGESAQSYLVSIATVLGRDISVSQEQFTKCLHYINSCFGQPKPKKEVQAIIDYIISGQSKIEGVNVWQYDENWSKTSFIFSSYKHETIEIFQYAQGGQNNYLLHNHITGAIKMYKTASAALDHIKSVAAVRIDKNKLITKIKDVTLIDRPDVAFGYTDRYKMIRDEPAFNMYEWTREQQVFYQPQEYAQDYKYPETTLAALESSIGDKLYTHFLPFLRRKLMTRDHSPLFFVLYGVPHSFKSAIVNGVLAPLVHKRHSKVSVDVLTDKYNDWQLNTDIVLMDEVHHLVTADRIKMIKAINEITGNQTINGIRAMHSGMDNSINPQEITFFLTTNETIQLTTESAERRMVVFRSLTTVSDALGISNNEIQKRIQAETVDFAYYLSTEVKSLKGDKYLVNYDWKDENYKLFQENALTNEDQLVKAIDSGDFHKLLEILNESGFKEDEILGSFYELPKKPGIVFRLMNSRPDSATVDGIFDNASIDTKILRKKLQLVKHLSYNLVEYERSKPTGSRKVEWKLSEAEVGDEFMKKFIAHKNKVAPMQQDIDLD